MFMRLAMPTIVMLFVPRLALACPVCFGQNDSSMALAINAGVILMLGVVVAVLGGFATFIVYLMRRAALVADQPDGADDHHGRPHPQEGTARC